MVKIKKNIKILFIVLAIFTVLLSSFVVWQWNNLKAVKEYSNYSRSDLESRISKEDEVIGEALDKMPGTINELSEEDEKRLKSGEIKEQQAIDIMLGRKKKDDQGGTISGNKTSESTGTEQTEPSPADKSAKIEQIDELIAKVYVLRASYESKLDSLMQSAVNEFKALPEDEQASSKVAIFLKYAGQASGMENDCDGAINSIISELKPLLQDTGSDLSLIEEIENAYSSEKSLKKAYYISLFTGK